jgi:hypothetical protein
MRVSPIRRRTTSIVANRRTLGGNQRRDSRWRCVTTNSGRPRSRRGRFYRGRRRGSCGQRALRRVSGDDDEQNINSASLDSLASRGWKNDRERVSARGCPVEEFEWPCASWRIARLGNATGWDRRCQFSGRLDATLVIWLRMERVEPRNIGGAPDRRGLRARVRARRGREGACARGAAQGLARCAGNARTGAPCEALLDARGVAQGAGHDRSGEEGVR